MFFLWNGTESELIKFIDNLNQKHPTIKFEFTYFRTSITFLDTKLYNNENGTLLSIENQVIAIISCLLNWRTQKALRDNIPYCQALHINEICSKTSEAIKNWKDLKDAFIKRGILKFWTITLKEL